MSESPNPEEHIPLRPVEFEILLVLAGGESHGYGIITAARERSQGRVRIETGTLYRALRRLEDSGLLELSSKQPAPDLDDERRRYFSITPLGRRVAAAEARRMAAKVAEAEALLPEF